MSITDYEIEHAVRGVSNIKLGALPFVLGVEVFLRWVKAILVASFSAVAHLNRLLLHSRLLQTIL